MIKRFLALVALAFVSSVSAAEPIKPEAMPGLKIGAKAADFTLKNTAGQDVALKSLLQKGPVVLAFVRSADWCPFCRKQLQELQKDFSLIEATGARLVTISYDPVATNAAASTKLGLTLPLLSDPGSKVIDAYGIRNEDAKGRSAGVPHPVLFVLDRNGVIRAKLMRETFRDRPESAEIIAAVKSIH